MSTATPPEIREWTTAEGVSIFRLPLEAFPGFWAYAYLVRLGEGWVLIDSGSGVESANEDLDEGLRAVEVPWERLTHLLLTHGHIDHFGGVNYVRQRAPQVQIGVHELGRRTVTNYEERLAVVARRLRGFLLEAGVRPQRVDALLQMYLSLKTFFQSEKVDFTYEAVGMVLGPLRLLHLPGHCPGQVAMRLDDVLFVGDHVLSDISPHQAPESLTLYTGLGHYLASLRALENWTSGVRLTLGGHQRPIEDLRARIEAIRQVHRERLAKVLALLEKPHTVAEVSWALFGEVHGYNVLLALEEAGAHVEYLYLHGCLGIANLAEVEQADGGVPLRYYRLPGIRAPRGACGARSTWEGDGSALHPVA